MDNGMYFEEHVMSSKSDVILVVGAEHPIEKENVTNYCSGMLEKACTLVSKDAIDLVKTKEVNRNRLQPGWQSNILGSGYFGHVYKGNLIAEHGADKPVAVKVLRDGFRAGDFRAFMEEAKTLIKAEHHENVISLVGTCLIDILSECNTCAHQAPLLLLELAEGGNLRSHLLDCKSNLQKQTSQIFTYDRKPPTAERTVIKQLMSFSLQVSLGMEHLSERKILHRDLAARNILLTSNNVIKIGDFGLSKQMDGKKYYRACTRWEKPAKWSSPEALMFDKYSIDSDVWSFGVLLWEIFSLGDEPYPDIPPKQLYDFLMYGRRLEKPCLASNKIYDIMLRCWKWEPSHRLTFSALSAFFLLHKNGGVESNFDDEEPLHKRTETSVSAHQSCTRVSFSSDEVTINAEQYLPGFFAEAKLSTTTYEANKQLCRTYPSPWCVEDSTFALSCQENSQKLNLSLRVGQGQLVRKQYSNRRNSSALPIRRFLQDSGTFEEIRDPLVFENQTYIKSNGNLWLKRHSQSSTSTPTSASSDCSADDSGFSKEFYCEEFRA